MTCEIFTAEMYVQRTGPDMPMSREFADHLQSCADCSHKFARMVEQDEQIRQTIRSTQAPESLEQSILSGLAADRAMSGEVNGQSRWLRWMLVPVCATLALLAVFVHVRWQAHTLTEQATTLLHSLPALGVEDGDRDRVLQWTAQIEPGTLSLPSRLSKLQFRGASAVRINNRPAVLLRMKHEKRASLLIVDTPLLGASRVSSSGSEGESLAYWTEERKTYVLLFQGNRQELQSYMDHMGITS